eukprot:gene5260-5145_t
MANTKLATVLETAPRFIRASAAPAYLGMCREVFKNTVRPHVREFPIGKQGVGFDRHELDQWADAYVEAMAIEKQTDQDNNPPRKAEQYLIHRLEKLRQEKVYGVRQVRTWREAATRFLVEFKDQASIGLSASHIEQLDPYLGDLPITHIDDGTLAPFWRDAEKRPWLESVPMISMMEEKKSSRKPYPLSWDEQSMLFAELPDHLLRMALYKVNTGCREQEVCKLRWDWEIRVPALNTSVFLIPAGFGGRSEKAGVKNGDERLVILNKVAMSIIDKQRGLHKDLVFPFESLIEVSLARSFIYPFVFPFYNQLTDTIVVILSLVLLALFAVLLTKEKSREVKSLISMCAIAYVIYAFFTVYMRKNLTEVLGGYAGTFPDRYFMGLNIIVTFSFLVLAGSALRGSKAVRVLGALCLASFAALYLANLGW